VSKSLGVHVLVIKFACIPMAAVDIKTSSVRLVSVWALFQATHTSTQHIVLLIYTAHGTNMT